MKTIPLRKTQRILWKFITAPKGVAAALKEFPVILPIQDSPHMKGWERLDIYANMYFFRILGSLEEDFPMVEKKIGHRRFHRLVSDYLAKHPPSHWSLRYAGRFLPSFLKNYRSLKRWPYLGDLARFEWALIEAFDATDADLLTEEELKKIPPNRWKDIYLKRIPASFLTVFKKKCFLVWRKNLKVYYRVVAPEEFNLLSRLQKGVRFGKLCEKSDPQDSLRIASCLKRWLCDGLLRSTASPHPARPAGSGR